MPFLELGEIVRKHDEKKPEWFLEPILGRTSVELESKDESLKKFVEEFQQICLGNFCRKLWRNPWENSFGNCKRNPWRNLFRHVQRSFRRRHLKNTRKNLRFIFQKIFSKTFAYISEEIFRNVHECSWIICRACWNSLWKHPGEISAVLLEGGFRLLEESSKEILV